MSWLEFQMPWQVQNLQALEHWYGDLWAGFGVWDRDAELYGNDNKQYHAVFDTETSTPKGIIRQPYFKKDENKTMHLKIISTTKRGNGKPLGFMILYTMRTRKLKYCNFDCMCINVLISEDFSEKRNDSILWDWWENSPRHTEHHNYTYSSANKLKYKRLRVFVYYINDSTKE